MSIKMKIEGGTTNDGTNLCVTCRHAHVLTLRSGGSRVSCDILDWSGGSFVPGPVVECNKYMHANHPRLSDMEEIAWQLRTDKSGRDIGFCSPDKLRKLTREGRIEDE